MPIPTSYPDIFTDWGSLAAAMRAEMAAMPDLEPYERTLTRILEEAEALKAAQEQYEGLRQVTTQKLRAKIAEGREAVIRARRMIGARLGPRNEGLVQFGIAPIRKQGRRSRKARATEAPGS
jgi:hypothetical protein